jgi:hypothetical protein
MLSFHALARDRSTLATLALVCAIAAGPVGPTSVAAADDAPSPGAAATTPASAPTPEATPTPAEPSAPPAPEATPTPAEPSAPLAPAIDPAAASGGDSGTVSASAVVLPGPGLVPNAERISPISPGPSLRFISAGHHLRTARLRTMNVKVDVAGAASLRAWAILPSQAVKAAKLEGRRNALTLARRAIKKPMSGRTTVKLQFDGPAQEALLRFYKVTVTVRLSATDAKGNVTTIERFVELID